MINIGIDPGLRGGIAAIDQQSVVLALYQMPVAGGLPNAAEVAHLLRTIASDAHGEPLRVWLEKVSAMPKQGVSSTFTFGAGWGIVFGAVAAIGLPLQLVTPQAWKKAVLVGLGKKPDKRQEAAFAARKWPDAELCPGRTRTPQDGLVDALCIAEYGRSQP